MTLYVPDVTPDDDTLGAALKYAAAGWYVLPVDPRDKNPGSVVGKGWPAKSSRNQEQLVAEFAGTNYALALHVGRSGAIAFDVDHPDKMPAVLAAAVADPVVPHQSTRTTEPGRGHFLYAVPEGRTLSNGKGSLRGPWGEVRGRNGVVVVCPTEHVNAAEGGRYEWLRTGPLPVLPAVLADELPDAPDVNDAATDAEVTAFLKQHTEASRPDLLDAKVRAFLAKLSAGESRHEQACGFTVGALKEARAGYYPAADAEVAIRGAFLAAATSSKPGDPHGAIRTPGMARGEWLGIVSWAVAQAQTADIEGVRSRIAEHMPENPAEQTDPWADDHPPEGSPFDPADTDEADRALEERLAFNRAVATEAGKLRVRQEAARVVRLEALGDHPAPDVASLAELLARPVDHRWRIDGLLPAGGRLLLSAQRKTGKTIATGNMARSLLTGEPFLGRFDVTKLDGRIVVLNYEVTGEQYAAWMDDIGVPHDRLCVVNLRGRRNLLADDEGRAELVEIVRSREGQVMTVDPFGRSFTGRSQNDAAEVAPWLVRLDEVAEQAGCTELILTAHAGWDGERTRGSSALEDWPDSIVTMTRDPDTDQRFIKADGRDVDLEEDRLDYDPVTRRLSLSGAGNRRQVRARAHVDRLAVAAGEIAAAEPGIILAEMAERLRGRDLPMQKGDETKAGLLAEANGWLQRVKAGRSVRHYPPGWTASVTDIPPNTPTIPDHPRPSPGVVPNDPPIPLSTGGSLGGIDDQDSMTPESGIVADSEIGGAT